MSQDRKIKWLNDRRIIYRRDPINDKPTINTGQYDYYEDGTYECYTLFNSNAKITTYRSLKWHMLVLYYLNEPGMADLDIIHMLKFIAEKENGFVTFFIKHKLLFDMIESVMKLGGNPPKNKIRKIIFKDFSGLDIKEKLSIVGQLIGRSKLKKETIYQCMLDINDKKEKITYRCMAKLLSVSQRTIYRHVCDELKLEKQKLNEEI